MPEPEEVADICAFAPRCRWARDVCRQGSPPLVEIEPGRFSACVRIEEIRDEMNQLRQTTIGDVEVLPAPEVVERPLISIQGVSKTFKGGGAEVPALKDVTMAFDRGESVGLVGESGSGKTTRGRCLVGLETPTSGSIEIDGIDASDYQALDAPDRAQLRGTVQIVFQDPYSSLNPRHTVERTLWEAFRLQGSTNRSDVPTRAEALLDQVGLPAAYAGRKPASLSGGERQRVAIARALAMQPDFLICDEPVSALDVSVQAQILNLFKSLRDELGIGYLFITHDLAVVRQVVERAYVLLEGEVVEEGAIDDLFDNAQHPYTKRLIGSVPRTK